MSAPVHYDVLIIGGGHAGAQAAIALRQLGFGGSAAIATREAELPYERPPLSKDYLSGDREPERLLIRPAAFWAERHVDMLLRHEAVAIDPRAQRVTFGNGRIIAYGALVWAAGGFARRIGCAGGDLAGVHSIRSKADVDRLLAELPDAERVAVIGGGYIGLEAAAVLRKLGREVTLLEAADRLLSRVAGRPISDFYEAEHRRHGVAIRTGVSVSALEGTARAAAVRLADGTAVSADLVIVGIGIVPEVAPLRTAGAAGRDGVDVDAFGRTSLPNIYAAGDCAAHENRFAGGARVRLESVQNANDQAVVVAKAILGRPSPYDAVPWFWSNQYDLKLQTVGIAAGADAMIVRGDPAARSFSTIYLKSGRVIALDCVNAVKDYVQGRNLVAHGAFLPAEATDIAVPLKAFVVSQD